MSEQETKTSSGNGSPKNTPDKERTTTVAGLVADALVSPPAAALYLALILFVVALTGLTSVSYFGHQHTDATRFARDHFTWKLIWEQARILCLYLAVALAGGLAAWGLFAARGFVAMRLHPQGRAWRLVRGMLMALAIHLYFYLRAAIETPQLFADQLYGKGGIRKALHVFLTDRLGLGLMDLLAVLLCLVFVFTPLLQKKVRDRWISTIALRRRRKSRYGWQGFLWSVMPFGLFVALVATIGFSLAPSNGSEENKGPNILILAADSMRADRLEKPYSKVAPHLHELVKRSVFFRRAYSSLPRTFPSWLSLLTGRFPHSHGVRHMFPSPSALSQVGPSLVSHLVGHGYTTEVISDYAGEIFGRVNLGFGRVDVPAFSFYEVARQSALKIHTPLLPYIRGEMGHRLMPPIMGFPDSADPFLLARKVMGALDRLKDKKRFFMTVFFSTPHFPYAAPYPYYRKFSVPGYQGPFKYSKTLLFGEQRPSATDIRQVRGLFDGAVAATDDAIAMVLEHLRRLGLSGKTIVVIAADHGENIYEADLGMGHGDHLRGEVSLRLPLVIHAPGIKGRSVDAVVRDVDLAPTLSNLAGFPMKGADGVDLTPLMKGEKKDLGLAAFTETGLWFTLSGDGWTTEDRIAYPEVLGGLVEVDPKQDYTVKVKEKYEDLVLVAKHRAIRTRSWKLIYKPLREGVRLLLFDPEKDPHNLKDLAAEHKDVVADLWKRLKEWMLRDRGAVARGDYVVPSQEPPQKQSQKQAPSQKPAARP